MAKRYYIVQGDLTTHGGVVIGGDELDTIDDIPMARQGDGGYCPQCKCPFFILEGLPDDLASNGQGFAVEGMAVSCGAFLVSERQRRCYYEDDSDGIDNRSDTAGQLVDQVHDEKRYLIVASKTGNALADHEYIAHVGGVKQEGISNGESYADI